MLIAVVVLAASYTAGPQKTIPIDERNIILFLSSHILYLNRYRTGNENISEVNEANVQRQNANWIGGTVLLKYFAKSMLLENINGTPSNIEKAISRFLSKVYFHTTNLYLYF